MNRSGHRVFCAIVATAILATGVSWEHGSAQAETWRDAFKTEIPEGWTVAARTFRSAPVSRILLARSPTDTVTAIGFFDGEPILEGLTANTLTDLLRAYLDGFFQARGADITHREPWRCKLDVPSDLAVRGERVDLELADGQRQVAYACASRDLKRGTFVVVLAWQTTTPEDDADPPEEGIAVIAATGLVTPR